MAQVISLRNQAALPRRRGGNGVGDGDLNEDVTRCVISGDLERLRRFVVECKADVNHRQKYGYTALIRAAAAGNADCVQFLLEHKAQVSTATHNGSTALLDAAGYGNVDCVERLLQWKADVNHKDSDDRTALIWAASNRHSLIVKLLVTCNADIHCKSKWGSNTAVDIAARNGDMDTVMFLLEQDADIAPAPLDACLFDASQQGALACMELLLERKADVNYQSSTGRTGLMEACNEGFVACTQLLLDHKADVNCQDTEGMTGLMCASRQGHVDCVDLLVEHKADVSLKVLQGGYTGLIFACRYGHVQIACKLLEKKADVNIQLRGDGSALTNRCLHLYNKPRATKDLLGFVLLASGATVGVEERDEEVFFEHLTWMEEFHGDMKSVFGEEVVVDTRIGRRSNGLYHEPLECVMHYCGLELMLEGDTNIDEGDPLPYLLRGSSRPTSALYWWNLCHARRQFDAYRHKLMQIAKRNAHWYYLSTQN